MPTPRQTRKAPRSAELGLLLAQARRTSWYAVARRLEARGDSVYGWQVLNHLARLGSVTQRELAVASAQHPAGISRQLDELEQRGLVRRRASSSDARARVVGLTAAGRAELRAVQPDVEAAMDEVLSALAPGEVTTLRALLRKLVGNQAAPRSSAISE